MNNSTFKGLPIYMTDYISFKLSEYLLTYVVRLSKYVEQMAILAHNLFFNLNRVPLLRFICNIPDINRYLTYYVSTIEGQIRDYCQHFFQIRNNS